MSAITGTFGYESKGATGVQVGDDTIYCGGYDMPYTVKPLSVHVFIKQREVDLDKVKCAIYDALGTGQRPLNLYATTEEKTVGGAWNGFQTFNVTTYTRPLMTPQIYYLCCWSEGRIWMYWDAAVSGNLESAKVTAYNGFPDPMPTPAGPDPNRVSIYCTYELMTHVKHHPYKVPKKVTPLAQCIGNIRDTRGVSERSAEIYCRDWLFMPQRPEQIEEAKIERRVKEIKRERIQQAKDVEDRQETVKEIVRNATLLKLVKQRKWKT